MAHSVLRHLGEHLGAMEADKQQCKVGISVVAKLLPLSSRASYSRFAYSPLETIDESENVVTPNFGLYSSNFFIPQICLLPASDTLKMRNINRQDSREDHSGDV